MILLGMSKEEVINEIINLSMNDFQACVEHLNSIIQMGGVCLAPSEQCFCCLLKAYGNSFLCTREKAFSTAEEILNEIRISISCFTNKDRNLIARKNSVGSFESIW